MYLVLFIFSIWQSILFFEKEPGISVALFVLPFIFFLIRYLEKQGKIKNINAKLIAIPIVLLSSTYFIFNNDFLRDLNSIVIPGLTVLMVIELIVERFTLECVINNVFNFIMKPIGLFGIVGKNIIRKIRRKEKAEYKEGKNIKRVFKAIGISLPVLIVVLILLITADSDFAQIFSTPISNFVEFIEKIQLSNMVSRMIIIVFMFFYMAGFVENIVNTNDIVRNNKELKTKDTLTIKMLLTLLNIIYVVFCIIQIRFLFKLYAMNKNNINYSYYARQGFFQLMVVSAINLITILISKSKCYKKEAYIKVMDLTMIALTSIILISSFVRMVYYETAYGLTLLRVLVSWAEITEAILLIPTAMYVLDKKLNLAKSYFIIITTMYVVLNFANINKMIAKVNVDMYLKRGSISGSDVYYLTNLGTDAIPETIRLLDIVGEEEQEYLDVLEQIEQVTKNPVDESLNTDIYYDYIDDDKKILMNRMKEIYEELQNNKTTWQEFNISKHMAKKVLEKNL